MSNMQFYLAIALPILAVLTSLTVSLIQISGLREDMRGMRSEFRDDVRGMRSEVREEVRGIRADLSTLTGKVIEMDNRLTRIEERMERG